GQGAPPRAHPRGGAAAELAALRAALRGPVLAPGDAGYEEARRVYNAMVDRRPWAIARCAGAGDVRAALAFARERGWHPAVRGGGHSVAGHSVSDGGLTIDLSAMKGIHV